MGKCGRAAEGGIEQGEGARVTRWEIPRSCRGAEKNDG